MKKKACFLLVCGAFLTWGIAGGLAQDNGNGMTTNPKYKFWASFKPGANSTYTQATKFHGAEKSLVPGGIDHKTITYRLLNTSPDKVVVLTTVVEEDFLSTVESAPTRITFPAMVKKANLDAVLQEWSAKEGEDEIIKVGNKEIKCKVRSGSHKIDGGMVEFKICYSDTVPGGIVRQTRTTRDGDKIVAETTTNLVSFAETKAGKAKE